MVDETGDFMNAGDGGKAASEGKVWGSAGAAQLEETAAPHSAVSLLATAYRLGVPATVHVAIGTDTIHHHPACDGASLGETIAARLPHPRRGAGRGARGGGAATSGSAVVMPEVFLKALPVARNLGAELSDLTTVNFDQIQHYRPRVNVVERPTRGAGARAWR